MASIRLTPPLVIAAGAVWPPVCVAVVTLRFVARRMQSAPLKTDDWLVLPALVLVIGIAAAILRGAALQSVGYPTPKAASVELAMTTSSYQQTITRQVFWAVELMQVLALTLIKLSCMFFYRRVFRAGGSKLFDLAMFTIVAIIVVWAVSFFFAFLFMCGTHFDYLWTSLANEAKCAKTMTLQNGFAISDVITDFLVLLFPLPLIWRLQMSRSHKVAVTGILLLGALAVAASITRMVIYVQATAAEFSSTPPDEDLLSSAAIYTMIIEAGFGLCAANLPTLYGMVRAKGIQTLLNSLRSFISLHNGSRSNVSGGSDQEDNFRRFRSKEHDSESQIGLQKGSTEPKRSASEYELSDMKPHEAIRVTKDVDVACDMV